MDDTAFMDVRVTVQGGTLVHSPSGAVLEIGEKTRTVGRGALSDLRLADKRVSTTHIEAVATPRGVRIRDCHSKNGTRIGPAELGPGQFSFVREATTVTVGNTVLHFTPGPRQERAVSAGLGLVDSRSPAMQAVLEKVEQLARTRVPVHLTGPTGTGKTFFARLIHSHSSRASKPFVTVDCSSIPRDIVESELFGHEPGAFTGAVRRKEGLLTKAQGGTVFLDEVGELPPDLQPKLLRFADEGKIRPIGGTEEITLDVRIISATLHNLAERINDKLFREDLYHRLTAVSIELPSLSERRDDIETLTKVILAAIGRPEAYGAIAQSAFDWMKTRPWNGNVRQLQGALRLAVDLWSGDGNLDIEKAYAWSGGGVAAPPRVEGKTRETVFEILTARGTDGKAVVLEAYRVLFERLVPETGGNLAELRRRTKLSVPFLRKLLAILNLRAIEPPRLPKRPRGPRRRKTRR